MLLPQAKARAAAGCCCWWDRKCEKWKILNEKKRPIIVLYCLANINVALERFEGTLCSDSSSFILEGRFPNCALCCFRLKASTLFSSFAAGLTSKLGFCFVLIYKKEKHIEKCEINNSTISEPNEWSYMFWNRLRTEKRKCTDENDQLFIDELSPFGAFNNKFIGECKLQTLKNCDS